LIEDDPQKAIKTWGIYNGANLIFIILSMIFVFTWAEEIVTYFHVKEVSELSHYLKIATLIPIFYSISLAMKQLMLSKNLNIPYINITIILVGVSTLFLILAIPYFKLTGVLAVLLVTEFIFLILFAYFAIKIISAYMKSRLLSRSTDITNPSNGY
jgi:O-antigen/teichoic acid export membrane protein